MSGKDIRETVGLLAVVASLVFVGWEIRQSNTLAHAAAYESIGTRLANSWVTLGVEYPQLAQQLFLSRLTAEDLAALSDTEVTRIVGMVVAMLRQDEITWRQVQLGLLDNSVLNHFGNDSPGAVEDAAANLRLFWPMVRPWMSPDFAAYMESGFLGLTAP